MSLLQQVMADPLTYIVAIAIFAGKAYLERRIPRAVDHLFDKKLADHEHALELITEQARFDYQRRLASDNIYAAKKHEVASNVYAAFRVAHGYVAALFGATERLSFVDYDAEDLAKYLDSRGVPQGMKKEILAFWPHDKAGARRIMDPYLRVFDVHDAEQKLKEAKNLAYLNELYLTDAAGQAINGLVGPLSEWVANAKYPTGASDGWRPNQKLLDDALTVLHTTLRDELAPRKGPLPARAAEGAA